ncbi:MAG: hypothetical protein H6563_12790 [Lewinellaceae bacterium]|nr:hypothetical protein [Lewinellaceae bacterium]
MIGVIIFSVFILLIATLLLLPLEVEVNSERGIYRADIRGLLYFRLLPGSKGWKVLLRLFWWERDLTAWIWRAGKRKKAKKPGKRVWKMRPATAWKNWRKLYRLIASFQFRRFRLIVDTDDFILNAYLFPIVNFLCRKNRYVAINFMGENSVDIYLTNRIWRVVWALIRK